MKRKRSLRHSCSSPVRVTATHLLSFLAAAGPAFQQVAADSFLPQLPLILPQPVIESPVQRESFHLRHVFHHGSHSYPNLLRKVDVPISAGLCIQQDDGACVYTAENRLEISSNPINVQRLRDRSSATMDALMAAGRHRGAPIDVPSSAWTVDEISGPNVTDKETVLSLARMAANAYVPEPDTGEWQDVGGRFNYSNSFGWETDGLRGHIFADARNHTIVIAIKGTSPAVFDGADTTTNDKVNDNLFFGCCCGQGGAVTLHSVCDCMTSTFTCNSTCLVQNLRQEDRYYYAAKHLYNNVTALYPRSNIWLSGHSLGGSIGGLLGLRFGSPAVTFEAPGDAMPAARLGLPTPPGYRIGSHEPSSSTGGFHFGHTGDPVYMGTCSSCTVAGYAMDSMCHTGMECRYDTVKDKGFHNFIGNHKINGVIRDVIEAYDEPAKCEVVSDCSDCYKWKFYKSNSSQTTTKISSRTSSYSRTRTETCKTPGWFGCLDESTTSSPTSSTSIITTTSTSTCKTPGWFGCLDEITTTTRSSSSTTTSAPSTSTSTVTYTCKTPGFFGCKDETTSTSIATSTPVTRTSTCKTPGWFGCNDSTTITTTTTTTCQTPGWFGCNDPTTTGTTTTTTSHPSTSTCKTPGFFWGCKDHHPTAMGARTGELGAPKATPAPMITIPTPLATFYR